MPVGGAAPAPASASARAPAPAPDDREHDLARIAALRDDLDRTHGLALLFKALADDTRVKIAYALSRQELCVHEVATLVGTSEATASHHLRLLRYMGLARYRRAGKHVYYALDDDHVKTLIDSALEHFWEGRTR